MQTFDDNPKFLASVKRCLHHKMQGEDEGRGSTHATWIPQHQVDKFNLYPNAIHRNSRRHPEERSIGNPSSRLQRQTEEPSSIGLALRRLNDRNATIAAATKLKNRRLVFSITQTLSGTTFIVKLSNASAVLSLGWRVPPRAEVFST